MPAKNHRIPFYADENIPIPCVGYLRRKGVNVRHVYDENLVGQKDPFQFNHSRKLNRVLLSLDKDFEKFDGISLDNHPGVILITVGNAVPQNINRVLSKVLKSISEEFVENALIRISFNKIKRFKNGKVEERDI